MSGADCFFDTNVLLYLVSANAARADRVESLMAAGGRISVQVLNEFAVVATRKLGRSWPETGEVLDTVRAVCQVDAITVQTHDRARAIAARHRFAFYDALIIAAALLAGCRVLYSEDLHAGQRIDSQLLISNPFKG
jgi:predicted nucleic acid-binding protein